MRSAFFMLAAVALTGATGLRAQPPTAEIIPAGHHRVIADESCGTCTTKVCVIEGKATTKAVHGSVCKDYCRDHILPHCLRVRLGLTGECDCGTPSTYNVLTKKIVPGPEVPVCKVKDLSVQVPTAPAPK